jgi:coproporphyrinogen III oxidase
MNRVISTKAKAITLKNFHHDVSQMFWKLQYIYIFILLKKANEKRGIQSIFYIQKKQQKKNEKLS